MSNQARTRLGPPVGYISLLDEALLAREAKSGGYQKTPIRPSAAGSCTRELFYKLREFHFKEKHGHDEKNAATLRLLNFGHSVEYHLLRQFEALKDFEARYKQQVLSFGRLEVAKNPALSQWLEGSLDVVLWSEKHKCLADVKSKGGGWDFKARKSRWDSYTDKLSKMASVEKIDAQSFWVDDLEEFLVELDDPFFESNFLQVNLYLHSDFVKERGINHGAIWQYHKQDSRLREVRFRPSEKIFQATVAKFQKALDGAAENKAPPRDYPSADHYKCKFCPFAKTCWGKK